MYNNFDIRSVSPMLDASLREVRVSFEICDNYNVFTQSVCIENIGISKTNIPRVTSTN